VGFTDVLPAKKHPYSVLTDILGDKDHLGDVVRVKVLDVDQRGRIKLSIKGLPEDGRHPRRQTLRPQILIAALGPLVTGLPLI
jgi:polyribonucleotide nucleotidyltransferase